MRKLLLVFVSVVAVSACGKDEPSVSNPVEIALSAVIENVKVQTKAPFELTKPTGTNPVTAAIWASTTSGTYKGSQADPPEEGAENIDYHNSTCFTGDSRQLLDHKLFYPANKKPVYFVGLCPRSEGGWHAKKDPADTTIYNIAHHVFDGKTDVMFAKQISNSLETSSNPKVLTFRHVLTWIQFNVVADGAQAITTWGPVKKITIDSNNEVNIHLTADTCSFSKTGTDPLPAYCINNKGENTDEEFKNKEIALTTNSQPVAYTLCAAVPASAEDGAFEYSITVDTKNRPNTKVNIDLKKDLDTKFSGNTEGCCFVVTLNFKLGENIVTTTSINEWANAGFGMVPVEEK